MEVPREDVLKLFNLSHIEEIDLSGSSFMNDLFLAHLVKDCSSLRRFYLNDCPAITVEGLLSLPTNLKVSYTSL